MAQLYRQVPGDPSKYEPHNPGFPIWRLILCKLVSLLYDVFCRPMKDKKQV